MDSTIYSGETREEKLERLSKEHNRSYVRETDQSKSAIVGDLASYYEYISENRPINIGGEY
jgi:hypothetical protein